MNELTKFLMTSQIKCTLQFCKHKYPLQMVLKNTVWKIKNFFNLDFYVKSMCPQSLFVNFEFGDFLPFFGAEILQIQHSEPLKK